MAQTFRVGDPGLYIKSNIETRVSHYVRPILKVIRKFFETITKVLDGISGITKIFVCAYGCVVGPADDTDA